MRKRKIISLLWVCSLLLPGKVHSANEIFRAQKIKTSFSPSAQAQQPRTIQNVKVDLGGYHLQFHIIQGDSPTVVFESGGGDSSSVWTDIVQDVARRTSVRIVSYDRAGLGDSEPNPHPYKIVEEVEALEKCLKQLQINGDLILVAHSYGGFLTELFLRRNPSIVKGMVLVDASLPPAYTDAVVAEMTRQARPQLEQMQKEDPQRAANLTRVMNALPQTVSVMRNIKVPKEVAVADIVSEKPPLPPPHEGEWIRVHQDFDRQSPKRHGVVATGSGHLVMHDRPDLVIDEILAMVKQVE
jgi:pimeloyl-ACP methyl ester carboxylesterase